MPSPPEAYYQAQPIAPSSQPPNLPNSTLQTTVQSPTVNAQRPKKKCMLSDCPDPVAPSMWHQHMSLHASGYYSGRVPNSWLKDQHLFVCSSCHQLVSISRTAASHSRCCREQAKSPATLTAVSASSPTEPNQGLYHPLRRCVSSAVLYYDLSLPEIIYKGRHVWEGMQYSLISRASS